MTNTFQCKHTVVALFLHPIINSPFGIIPLRCKWTYIIFHQMDIFIYLWIFLIFFSSRFDEGWNQFHIFPSLSKGRGRPSLNVMVMSHKLLILELLLRKYKSLCTFLSTKRWKYQRQIIYESLRFVVINYKSF